MMGRRHARPAALALGMLAAVAAAGAGCSREPPVATALEAAGTVERGAGADRRGVERGTTFAVGDTLRTGGASHARLSLLGGSVIRVGENARLRFQRGRVEGQKVPDIAVELGSAELEETASPISIVTAVGPTRVERGARVRVRADGQTASIEVVVGRAVMLEAGREVPIDAGQGVRIRIGSAEIQRFALKVGEAVIEAAGGDVGTAPAAAPADAGTAPAAAAPADAGAPTAEASAAGPPGEAAPSDDEDVGSPIPRADAGRADITLAAGESATVHDGRSSSAIRLRLDGLCTGDAIVEVGGRGHHHERFAGARAVVLRLRSGTRSYRVRCTGDRSKAAPRASGTLSIRRDTGYVPLARRAPTNVIDADGRRYTVLFQTRLPQLTLAWPSAPTGAALELHLDSAAGARVIPAASPSRPLPSGTVGEGTYTFWYRAADGRQSPKTTVGIRFDNAAPTAQFFRTAAARTGPRGSIAVDGVTVEGAKVSVAGQPLAVDGHGRFRGDATPLDGDDAVGVRLEHPRTGVHYYVRRRTDTR